MVSLRSVVPLVLVTGLVCPGRSIAADGRAPINAYNPYADSQQLPPVAPDGTLRWGTFYKSAALQQAYERLWHLGACRGTNKAITIPVESNKVAIDTLPEETFRGIVVGTAGTLEGGLVAFTPAGPGVEPDTTLVAALHPAGVSRLSVSGRIPVGGLRPGMTARVSTRVDRKGAAVEAATALDVITLPAGFKPEPVVADRPVTAVGTLTRIQGDTVWLQVGAGRIRRLAVPLAADAVVRVEASQLELVAPGDVLLLEGRVWRGEGCLGDGTVFASRLSVTKPEPAGGPATRIGTADSGERGGF